MLDNRLSTVGRRRFLIHPVSACFLFLSRWHQCTYSSTCSEIGSYRDHVACADDCLRDHKEELERRKEDERIRRQQEERRKKEAEALLQSSGAEQKLAATSALAMSVLMLWRLH